MATPPAPQEAIDYLKAKGVSRGFSFRDVWREEHQHSFTVAKMMDGALLADVQESLVKAQRDGIPYAQWAKEMEDLMSRRGWWGKKTVTDPVTGEQVVEAQLGSSRRLQTIWRVNMRQASQVGVWERAQRSRSHPYLIYRVGPSREHRQQHLAWDGVLLPKGDPWWSIANPSNGWGCKCFSRAVSAAQHRRYVRDGIAAPVQGDGAPGKKAVQTTAPTLRPVEYENPRTGQRFTGYAGISEGFEYNPGERQQREERQRDQFRATDRRLAASAGLAPAIPKRGTTVGKRVNVRVRGELADVVRKSVAAIDSVHGTRALPPVDITRLPTSLQQYYDGSYDDRWSRGSSTPDEIRVSLGNEPWLTVAHEVGHLLDRRGLPGRSYASARGGADEVLQAVRESGAYVEIERQRDHVDRQIERVRQELAAASPDGRAALRSELRWWRRWRLDLVLMLEPEELWARAYAQWVAWRSGSPEMLAEVDGQLRDDPLQAWARGDFAPIAAAIDAMLLKHGWLKTPTPTIQEDP